jgi:DNA-directed RNA polymerase specialized sigma24 family protein
MKMGDRSEHKSRVSAGPDSKSERKLLTLARKGDRKAYLELFTTDLAGLDRFVRHELHYSETIGAVERGLIDPSAIIDQVYIAGLNTVTQMPAKATFRSWLRYLGLHILRQQVRIEHREEPAGLSIERSLGQDSSVDTELWEFYQPDDVTNVEDLVVDHSALDPEVLMELHETAKEIEQSIDQLPTELREPMRLRKLQGLEIDEIAALLLKTPAEILQALQEAAQALRKLATGGAEQ